VHFEQTCSRFFAPESLCAALVRLEESGAMQQSRPSLRFSNATAPHIAVAAAVVQRNPFGADAVRHLDLSVADTDPASELGVSAALTALATSLERLNAGGQRVTIRLGTALTQRRLVQLLVQRLGHSLRSATGLVLLSLEAAPGVLRAADEAVLRAAAQGGWQAREVAVLLGTHASSSSPLRLLPAALIRQILDLAAASGRTRLCVEHKSATAPPPAGAPHPHAAPAAADSPDDLSFVAMLMRD
jgi:hypothetical protein